ncbi:MAG: hypothetical protein R3A11_04975 [Bdellovibrionota bacterium]
MKTTLANLVVCLTLLALSGGLWHCGPKGSSPSQTKDALGPGNIRSFAVPYAKVWETVLETIKYDFLFEIEVEDQRKGYFSTALVRDFVNNRKIKYRISGTFSFDGQTTIVKLYKHEEFEEDGYWNAVASNNQTEKEILNKVAARLGS